MWSFIQKQSCRYCLKYVLFKILKSLDCKGTPATEYTSIDMNQRKGESIEMETLGEVAGNCEEQEEEINS